VSIQLWSARDSYIAFFQTVYPGDRRSGGMASVPTWSGDLSWALQFIGQGNLTSSNQSELSLGLLILFPFIIGVTPFFVHNFRNAKENLVLLSGILFVGIYVIWALAPLPARLNQFNPLKFMPPDRVQQISGLLVLILFVIFLERLNQSKDFTDSQFFVPALLAATITAFVLTLNSNIRFLGYFTETQVLTLWKIWVMSIFIVALIFFVIRSYKSKYSKLFYHSSKISYKS
jgi:hypothetical protein